MNKQKEKQFVTHVCLYIVQYFLAIRRNQLQMCLWTCDANPLDWGENAHSLYIVGWLLLKWKSSSCPLDQSQTSCFTEHLVLFSVLHFECNNKVLALTHGLMCKWHMVKLLLGTSCHLPFKKKSSHHYHATSSFMVIICCVQRDEL